MLNLLEVSPSLFRFSRPGNGDHVFLDHNIHIPGDPALFQDLLGE